MPLSARDKKLIGRWPKEIILGDDLSEQNLYQVVERMLFLYAKLNPGQGYVQVGVKISK